MAFNYIIVPSQQSSTFLNKVVDDDLDELPSLAFDEYKGTLLSEDVDEWIYFRRDMKKISLDYILYFDLRYSIHPQLPLLTLFYFYDHRILHKISVL